ncbi:cytidine deaminase [Aliifodinibius salipaludis]|uniref:Cytidine deaminase n=1 Tax=Fodinibius salipaludis TaxID=2032627 RepID=A0A2A2GFM5_9BACT|nr:cytidine deaminase [Aliifodinibius salipaludis]PAU95794.1 cytidine deaminase [Aliifodinibius salipaludis]
MDINDLYEQNYVPYSKKASVAVVRSKNGKWFPGVRIENICYPLSISATQNALFYCLSEGHEPAELFTDEIHATMIPSWEKELGITSNPLEKDELHNITFDNPVLEADLNKIDKLKELLDMAVVGESDFPVSAIVETEQGYFTGVNIECTSWNMGLCAERVAIAKALTFSSKNLISLEIHTRKGEFSSPCGACRQVIKEHLPKKQIHLHHADDSESIHFSEDLLPHSFSSSSLSNR